MSTFIVQQDLLITMEMLKLLNPEANITNEFLILFNQYANDFHINTKLRISHFLSQVSYESGRFTKTKESLYYSKDRFLELYKNTKTPNGVDFNNEKTYSHLIKNDSAFANWRYGYTNKNGVLVNHRGRGYIHITWKENYQHYTDYYQEKYHNESIDFVESPELLEIYPYSLESAFFFWHYNNINSIADKGSSKEDIQNVTRKVNGGLNGIDGRITNFNKILVFFN